jgi:hypothetical protein
MYLRIFYKTFSLCAYLTTTPNIFEPDCKLSICFIALFNVFSVFLLSTNIKIIIIK